MVIATRQRHAKAKQDQHKYDVGIIGRLERAEYQGSFSSSKLFSRSTPSHHALTGPFSCNREVSTPYVSQQGALVSVSDKSFRSFG